MVVHAQVDRPRQQCLAVLRRLDPQRRRVVQPGGESRVEASRHMLDDQDGNGKILGQRGQDPVKGRRAAGGGGNGDDLSGRVVPGRRGWRRDQRLRGPRHLVVAHDLDPGHGLDLADELARLLVEAGGHQAARLGVHGQRTHPHGLERHRQGTRIQAGDDENGSRSLHHDALGGPEPVEHRHLHVHGHDVGGEPLHHLHRGQAVCGFAHHVHLGVAAQDPDEELARRGRIVDHEHADPLHRS